MQDRNANFTVAGHPPLSRFLFRSALGLSVAGIFLWLLSKRLGDVDPALILPALHRVAYGNWLLAFCFATISFGAIGEYDRLFHRLSGTALPATEARLTGMAAMALAQVLGLGVLSGALVRWRLVSGFDLWTATQFSALVSASFLAGFGVFTASAILLFPASLPPHLTVLSQAALVCTALIVAAFVILRRVEFRGRIINLPPLGRLARIFAIVTVDCLAAAACAYVLMPEGAVTSFATFLPVFVLALGAGLVSGAPAGVGPFDLSLLAMIPVAGGHETLLAAVLAFRLVYFVLPALIAVLLLLRGSGELPETPTFAAETSLPAEAFLTGQGWFNLLKAGQTALLVAPTGQALVSLGDAVGHPASALKDLTALAKSQNRLPCLYKIGPRSAVLARSAGYTVLRISAEAMIEPRTFNLSASACAGLRRKLRKAEAAGVHVTRVAGAPPLARLTAINAEWSARHGGERGFSMGRYVADHLRFRILLIATQENRTTAFMTFAVETDQQGTIWRLDLMRHVNDLAEGTMHAIVAHAVALARDHGVTRLSLAAAPALSLKAGDVWRGRFLARAEAYVVRKLGGSGLRQFKQSFAPTWKQLYIAAPGPLRLCIAGAEIAAAVARPGPQNAKEHIGQVPVCLEPQGVQ